MKRTMGVKGGERKCVTLGLERESEEEHSRSCLVCCKTRSMILHHLPTLIAKGGRRKRGEKKPKSKT